MRRVSGALAPVDLEQTREDLLLLGKRLSKVAFGESSLDRRSLEAGFASATEQCTASQVDDETIRHLHGLLLMAVSVCRPDNTSVLACLDQLYDRYAPKSWLASEEGVEILESIHMSCRQPVEKSMSISLRIVQSFNSEVSSYSQLGGYLVWLLGCPEECEPHLLEIVSLLSNPLVEIAKAALQGEAPPHGINVEQYLFYLKCVHRRLSLPASVLPQSETFVGHLISEEVWEPLRGDTKLEYLSVVRDVSVGRTFRDERLGRLLYREFTSEDSDVDLQLVVLQGLYAAHEDGVLLDVIDWTNTIVLQRWISGLVGIILSGSMTHDTKLQATALLKDSIVHLREPVNEPLLPIRDLLCICEVVLDVQDGDIQQHVVDIICEQWSTEVDELYESNPEMFSSLARLLESRYCTSDRQILVLDSFERIIDAGGPTAINNLVRLPNVISGITESASSSDSDVRERATRLILRLSDAPDNRLILAQQRGLIGSLIQLVRDSSSPDLDRDAIKARIALLASAL